MNHSWYKRVFLESCGFRAFFKVKKGGLARVWYRILIDNKKTSGYTEGAVGNCGRMGKEKTTLGSGLPRKTPEGVFFRGMVS